MKKRILGITILGLLLTSCSKEVKTYAYYQAHIDEAVAFAKTCHVEPVSDPASIQECTDAIKAVRHKNNEEADKERAGVTYGKYKVDPTFYP